jgi:subtilisin
MLPPFELDEIPARSILILAEDIPPEDVPAEATRLAGIVAEQSGMSRGFVDQWTIPFPRLRTVVVPGTESMTREAIRVGTQGVIAIDGERLSVAPPGNEVPVPEITADESLAIAAAEPLDAMRVLQSCCSGDEKLIVVLDVGFFTKHPDFEKRVPVPVVKSFTTDDPLMDSGHGTRSVGLTCGPLKPSDGKPRYGVAHCAMIFFGRVMQKLRIRDAALIAGMEKAIELRASVVNMSCGSTIDARTPYSTSFELVAQRVLNAGVLPIAAAGNDSADAEAPVNHPANCPSVLCVGALDSNLEPLPESCVRLHCDGEVDIAAPGFQIRSSTIAAYYNYNRKTGTSSAAAFVSGVAALWAQKGYSGCDLWNVLLDNAVPVRNGSRKATGAGLVQAPRAC